MQKSENIMRYTANELASMESKTDWARVDAMTEEELEAAIASDPEDVQLDEDLTVAYPGLPPIPENKQQITLRIDADVLDWFRAKGKGYQTHINAVLRRHVGMHKLAEERAQRAAANGRPKDDDR